MVLQVRPLGAKAKEIIMKTNKLPETDEEITTFLADVDAGKYDNLPDPPSPTLMIRIIRMRQALEHANGLCRSAFQIAERDGMETNWIAFRACLKESLDIQHAEMFPPPPGFSSQNASGEARPSPPAPTH